MTNIHIRKKESLLQKRKVYSYKGKWPKLCIVNCSKKMLFKKILGFSQNDYHGKQNYQRHKLTAKLTPVSYTHLDVYKRQPISGHKEFI